MIDYRKNAESYLNNARQGNADQGARMALIAIGYALLNISDLLLAIQEGTDTDWPAFARSLLASSTPPPPEETPT
jgi:hypothetical protein